MRREGSGNGECDSADMAGTPSLSYPRNEQTEPDRTENGANRWKVQGHDTDLGIWTVR